MQNNNKTYTVSCEFESYFKSSFDSALSACSFCASTWNEWTRCIDALTAGSTTII
jgi:hypothetical protein